MPPLQDDYDDAQPGRRSSFMSRRRLLQMSAAGGTIALMAAGSLALSGGLASEGADWTTADMPPQSGRRVLVTGGNGFPESDRSGLGYHNALALARAGADVTIASRNVQRGEEAVRRIMQEAPASAVRFLPLDLADLGSVRAFAARMGESGQALDLLVNNAGVMGRPEREVSVDGFERVFATNTLGHFALTALLLPMLRQGRDPRIVWVSSSRTASALPFDDLQLERDYDYGTAYDNTKLANLLLSAELDRRSKAAGWGIASLAAHPGVARTNLIPDGPGLDSAEGWRFRMLPFLFQPAAQGALSTLYAATAPEAVPGGYYGPTGFGGLSGPPGPASLPAVAQDERMATTLWAALEQMAQVSAP